MRHERDGTALHWMLAAVWWCVCAGLQLTRWAICAVMVLVAFLSFLVTLIFGLLSGDPRLPRWGC